MDWRHFAFLLCLCITFGCGSENQLPPNAVDLLARSPDYVQHQFGVLRPSPAEQWGEHGHIGWEAVTNRTEREDLEYVWSKIPQVGLTLSAGAPRDRALALVLWTGATVGPSTTKVGLSLNGVSLGSLDVGTSPREYRLATPAQIWRRGGNLLRLSVERLVEHPSGTKVGVALAEVRYDEPRMAEVDPEACLVVLQPDTGVTYQLEPGAGAHLLLRGSSSGRGNLDVHLTIVDRESGEVREPLTHMTLRVSDEEIQPLIPTEVPAGKGLLNLALEWSSTEGAVFEIDRLAVFGGQAQHRPPIVLITIDTLSARNMSLYGYERSTTPNLERLAKDAVVFENGKANATWTVPSFMSMMTGIYPKAHRLEVISGLQKADLWEVWYLASNRWTLAESLRSVGYQTAGFIDNLWITERYGFPQGFETFDASAGEIEKADPSGGIRHVKKLAQRWLDQRDPTRPFFLFLHAFDVHGPYAPDEAFHGRFRADTLYEDPRTVFAGGMTDAFGIVPKYVTWVEFPDEPARVSAARVRAAYDEGVAMVDAEVGEFLEWLRAHELYDQALIVVTADHGETMESGTYYFGHGVLDEEVVQVPLLIKLPGNARGGSKVSQTVQLVDLFPTLQAAAGIEIERAYLHGRSLLPLLQGESLPPAPVLTEEGLMDQFAIESDGWKLVSRRPGVNSPPEVVLTSPDLRSLWKEHLAGAPRERTPEQKLYWQMTQVFLAKLDERGLTPHLFASFSSHPAWNDYVHFLRGLLSTPRYALYYLPTDRDEETDLASSRPDKVQELLKIARGEQEKRNRARALAQPPTKAIQLDEDDLEELSKLGYVEARRAE